MPNTPPLAAKALLATWPVLFSTGLFVAASTISPGLARAQCGTQWQQGDFPSGTSGEIHAATTWDPDGAGPAQPWVVVGGSFWSVGGATVPASHVAAYDPALGSWSNLGGGMSHVVHALATLPNGDLVAAGEFVLAGGVPASRIARWNGSTWSPLGSGMDGRVFTLHVMPNGDLIAGGNFGHAGGVPANHIACWNGSSWSALGSGMFNSQSAYFTFTVLELATLPNGHLVAGGWFDTAGGVAARNIARWDGTSWSSFGSGCSGGVRSLAVLRNGDVVAGGFFTSAGGVSASNIARWDGTSWSALGGGANGEVSSLTERPNGELIAGGTFTTAGGVPAIGIARWNGASWSTLGSGLALLAHGQVDALTTLPNGDLLAGGSFRLSIGIGAGNVATWDGVEWSLLGRAMNGYPRALAALPNGDIVVGGEFTTVGGIQSDRVAKWDGTSWTAFGAGLLNGLPPFWGPSVQALLVLPNGDLIAGGNFGVAGSIPSYGVARWNGSSWSALSLSCNGRVNALGTMANGDIVAGGDFTSAGGRRANGIARWNGTSWSTFGTGIEGWVEAITTTPNGDLIVGGILWRAGGARARNVARWNGASWLPLGAGLNGEVHALMTMPNGDVVAGGGFGMARWDGTSWSALGGGMNGTVLSLATLPNGDVVAGGQFTLAGNVGANRLARWDGISWTALGAGAERPVWALAIRANGELVAGGEFTTVGGRVSAYVARLTTTCPATASAYGAGCAGSAGLVALTAVSQPWTGSTFRATATGIAANAVGFSLLGLTAQSASLSSLHPAGASGCTLLLNPDSTQWLFPSHGSVATQLAIPNNVALAGIVIQHQVLQAELDPSLNLTSLSSSNALALTIGAF